MFTKDEIPITRKMKRGDAGLPRRKVCIRAVHHVLRLEPVTLDDSKENDNPPP